MTESDYYAAGASWAADRNQALRSSRKTAWIVAGAAAVIAVCEALALALLMPLKTVEPYTLMVDRQTGFVQALKPLDAQLVASDRALTQSFLVQYVIAREGFDYATVQSDYRKVGLWSSGSARTEYIAAMQAANPASPLARLPRSSVLDVQVKSVSPLGTNSALVRYDVRRRDGGGVVQPASAWVAVIQYRYSNAPLSIADRFVNPLGFQVERYRHSQEALPAPAVAAPMPAGAAPTTTVQP